MFGFCITHILNTGVLKFEKKVRRQKFNVVVSVRPSVKWPVYVVGYKNEWHVCMRKSHIFYPSN